MIKRIYIDNFKCLVNFEINPKNFQLWLGNNGNGKSSVLEALDGIRRVVSGEPVHLAFPNESLTQWESRKEQTIAVEILLEGDLYEYKLIVEQLGNHRHDSTSCRIKEETLKWNNTPFYHFDGQEAHLFQVNRKTQETEEGTHFPADWSRSMLASIGERDDNEPLVVFRQAVSKWLIVHPNPPIMREVAQGESDRLFLHSNNFAHWYWFLSLENQNAVFQLRKDLMEVLPGFDGLRLKEAGDAKRLVADFKIGSKLCAFGFKELSDGQRQLIVLYAILAALKAGEFSALFIDEPDNFVSLREIQPWQKLLEEVCDEENRQAVIISHHPEIINTMAHGSELWFSRPQGLHVRAAAFPEMDGLTPAEIIARGWDDE